MADLRFGALSPSLAEQLDSLGASYDRDALEHCQRDADAITRLSVRGLLTETQTQSAHKKLVRKIERALEEG